MDINVSNYGKNLCFVRHKLLLSMRKLSKIAGVKYQTIQALESGRQTSSDVFTALRLSNALGLSVQALVSSDLQK